MSTKTNWIISALLFLGCTALSCAEVSSSQPAGVSMLGLQVDPNQIYELAAGQAVFEDKEWRTGKSFVWSELSSELEGRSAVRHKLQGLDSLTVQFDGPGRVLALLWVWDFGLLKDGPRPATNINGWQLVDAEAARVKDYPWPLGLYSRRVPAAETTVNLKEYFGQWIVVGFERGGVTAADNGGPLALELAHAKTRHHVVDPGGQVILRASADAKVDDRSKVICELYDEGVRVARFVGTGKEFIEGIRFEIPRRPGRLWLQARVAGSPTETVLPLTVALPPIEGYASMDGFFPVEAWVSGTSHAGLASFCADDLHHRELDTINLLELGCNTWSSDKSDPRSPLLSALHARKILGVGNPRHLANSADAQGAAAGMLGKLKQNGPYGREVLAVYTIDEPPPNAEFFGLVEQRWKQEGPQHVVGKRPPPSLLHCMVGGDPEFWTESETTLKHSRLYPIRKEVAHQTGLMQITRYADRVRENVGDQKQPYWLIMQTFGQGGIWFAPSGGQIRGMANLALARGIKGLSYYCYGTNPRWGWYGIAKYPFLPDNDGGYAAVKLIGRKIWQLRDLLPHLRHRYSVAQRYKLFDVQYLTDSAGIGYFWVTNFDYDYPYEGMVQVYLKKGSGDSRSDHVRVQQDIGTPGTVLASVPDGETFTVNAKGEIPLSLEPGAGELLKVK